MADLGFGAKNQVIGDMVGKVMLEGASQQEAQIDDDMRKYDELMNDEDALEKLRARRLIALKEKSKKKAEWASQGHGRYMELSDTKEFFNAAKASERMVVHFYRSTTRHCETVNGHLEKLSQKHQETRFVKIDAEKSVYLVEKLGIVLMPTIVLVYKGAVVHHIQGFDELGGTDEFSTQLLAWVISQHKVLTFEGDMPEEYYKGKGINSVHVSMINGTYGGSDNIREGEHSYKNMDYGASDDDYD
jgi:thiol-disulfide isomerase/thioredoxin